MKVKIMGQPTQLVRRDSIAAPTLAQATRGPWVVALIVLLIFFGVGGVFASQAGLATSVIGTGRIVTEGQRRTVQPPELASIQAVMFEEGDRVEAGEVVVQLETRDIRLARDNIFTQLLRAAATEARLLAEQADSPTITWQHARLANRWMDPQVSGIIQNEQMLFSDRRRARESRAFILERRIAQLEAQIEGERTVLNSLEERHAIVLEELVDYQTLTERGLATRPRLQALRRDLAELSGSIGATTASISSLEQTIGETQLQIQSQATDYREEVSEALPLAQAERARLEQEFSQLDIRLERRALIASVSGRIINLKHSGAGPIVSPGEVIFEIIPEQERVLVEISVQPSDVDAIEIGMDARVVFSALSLQEERSTTGRLISISPDVFVDETRGNEYFRVHVEVPLANIEEDVPNLDLVMGMPTETYFLSGEKTLLAYLAEPIVRVLQRGLRE